MQAAVRQTFTSIQVEGGIISPDLLGELVSFDRPVPGTRGEDYHLIAGERMNEAITRSWNRMKTAWDGFSARRKGVAEADPATTLTRERLLLVLFEELAFGRLAATAGTEIEGKNYPISHMWRRAPIHLVGFNVDLDHRTPGVAGAATMSPHSMVQEYLNRSDEHLWAFLSNGLRLRILRDSRSITRQAYIEFDLEGIFEGDLFADFVVLWMLCHESRVEAERPEECWLERWSALGYERGTRALDSLRTGVESAIKHLGSGFLKFQANADLRDALKSGALSTVEFYREILQLVYRLIFLFVAEDRNLLYDPESNVEARDMYRLYYSTFRLRNLAESIRGGDHGDAYEGFKLIAKLLGDRGCPDLGLPGLGSRLWSVVSSPRLSFAGIGNVDFLAAIRSLALTQRNKMRWRVDFAHLGTEELGSIYESLLELHPRVHTDAHRFELDVSAGSERKTTGSYYTRPDLVQCLLDSALDPVLDRAEQDDDPETAILGLSVCDPACGSGHFLIAAAHRIARRLAAVRTGEEEPAPTAMQAALREVIAKCIYGVDVNPMSVELCKVSLWLEAMEPGKPLAFLDHHIQCGNSLLGATPELVSNGIPDQAFAVLEGDDKKVASAFKKQNKEAQKQPGLFDAEGTTWDEHRQVLTRMAELEDIDDTTIEGIRLLEKRYADIVHSNAYIQEKVVADAWCSAFVWPKIQTKETPFPLTQEVLIQLQEDPASVPSWIHESIDRYAAEYRFFHWHIAFPEVFRPTPTGWIGGFDVVLGNPPWERIKLQESEWFAQRSPEIANAANAAARKRMISALLQDDPALHRDFLLAKRNAEGQSSFVRGSARYPLCGRGDVNTYTVFAELSRTIVADHGRVGIIVPSGIATDDTTKFFFGDLNDTKQLVSLFDFENRNGLFPGVHRSFRFCLLTLVGPADPAKEGAEFVFFAYEVDDISDPEKRFVLTPEDFALMNPNTRTCPIFRTRRDAEITRGIYRRVPVLIKEGPPEENPWGIRFMAMFHMSNDSGLFRTREDLESAGYRLEGNRFLWDGSEAAPFGDPTHLPLYEAKMVHHYDHRAADIYRSATARDRQAQPKSISHMEKKDSNRLAIPLYWVASSSVSERMPNDWPYEWTIGFRDITATTNERTVICSIIPLAGVGNNLPLLFPHNTHFELAPMLLANMSSFALDYVVRQKIGGLHLNFFYVAQFPVFSPLFWNQECPWTNSANKQNVKEWFLERVIELTYTASDISGFASNLGAFVKPYSWNDSRRFAVRCEIEAAMFLLYGIERNDVDYIMDSFPIVRRNDEGVYGEYRTKRDILEQYDTLSSSISTVAT